MDIKIYIEQVLSIERSIDVLLTSFIGDDDKKNSINIIFDIKTKLGELFQELKKLLLTGKNLETCQTEYQPDYQTEQHIQQLNTIKYDKDSEDLLTNPSIQSGILETIVLNQSSNKRINRGNDDIDQSWEVVVRKKNK